MFNVTVLKMKDIKKYFIGIVITVLLIILICKHFPKSTSKENKITKIIPQGNMISCLEQTVSAVPSINGDYKDIENKTIKEENILQEILKTQVSSIKGIEDSEQKKNQIEEGIIGEATQETQNTENQQEVQKVAENLEEAKVRYFY